jgi:hypothetical protein
MTRRLAWLISATLMCFTSFAFAGSITKIKGNGAILVLDGEAASVGDSFFGLDANGKKKALLKIEKVKGDKALAKIVKGNATVGMSLQRAGSGGGSKSSASSGGGGSPSGVRAYWGGMVGYSMDSMSAQVNSAVTNSNLGSVALSGSGFSARGIFDYDVWEQIWFRGGVGIDQFKVSGDSKCGSANSSACNANIMYLAADFMGRYIFATGNYRPWLGAGLALLFPASKSTTALDSGSVGSTSVYEVAGGLDWFISKDAYIPISVEYGLLPKSDQVDAHWIALRVGFAVPF